MIPGQQPGQILIEGGRSYYYTFQNFTNVTGQWITSNCNEIAFWNVGTTTATINNVVVLAPQDYLSLNGNVDEIDKTQYTCAFSGSGQSNVIVIKKTYL